MHEQEAQVSGPALWLLYYGTTWAAGPSRLREGGAGQILPVFVIAAPFSSCCSRARAGPAERGACAFPLPSLILILTLIYRPVQRDLQDRERRSPRTKRFSIHPQGLAPRSNMFDVTVPAWFDRAQARHGLFVPLRRCLSFVSCRGCIWELIDRQTRCAYEFLLEVSAWLSFGGPRSREGLV